MVILQIEFGRVRDSGSKNGCDRDGSVFVKMLPFRQSVDCCS